MNKLPVLEHNGQRILTTQQLAEIYETSTDNIKMNFNNHKDKFVESKHYYLLKGDFLKEFKDNLRVNNIYLQISNMTRSLYLWTERGANRHCKILDTDKAWEQFDNLEETYFRIKETGIHKLKQKRRKPVDLIFRQNMNIAKTLSENTGVKEGIAFAAAIKRTEELSGEDLTAFKKLIPSIEHEIGYLNASMIGERIGLPAKAVVMLEADGLQYKDEKNQWRLTEEGKKYGEEFPFERNGHYGYQIRWNDKIIEWINSKYLLVNSIF